MPRWKGDIFGGWQNQSWEARATFRYTDGDQNSLTNIGITTQKNVASLNAVDLDAEYRGLKNWRFDLSVINVFNHYPPYDSAALLFFPTGTPYDPVTYDDLGRMIDLHFTYSFCAPNRSGVEECRKPSNSALLGALRAGLLKGLRGSRLLYRAQEIAFAQIHSVLAQQRVCHCHVKEEIGQRKVR